MTGNAIHSHKILEGQKFGEGSIMSSGLRESHFGTTMTGAKKRDK